MRWSVPRLEGIRGAGLGNEIFPWAKAYLGSRALGLKLVSPPWRLNARRYDREFDAGGWRESARYLGLRGLPSFDVTSQAFQATNETDYFHAIRRMAPLIEHQKSAILLHSSGMLGGYLGIRRAKPFLRHMVFGTPGAMLAMERLQMASDPCLRIGVHIRGGDFATANRVNPGSFNERLPLEWYVDNVRSLSAALSIPSCVYLATDSPSSELTDAFTLNGRPPESIASDSVGDLAVLASCDIVISSVSSFSMLGIFLSDAPYVWHRDQLGVHSGWLSIWGHEPVESGGGRTQAAVRAQFADGDIRVRRGIAQGQSPVWSVENIRGLETRARSRRLADDLIYYGVSEPEG